MSKIVIECFENGAEISSFEKTYSSNIEYIFNGTEEGFVNLNKNSYKIKNGRCEIDTQRLCDDEIKPCLIFGTKKIELPVMVKRNEEYVPGNYGEEFLRNLSLREARLNERVCQLEKRLNEISNKVYHTTVF